MRKRSSVWALLALSLLLLIVPWALPVAADDGTVDPIMNQDFTLGEGERLYHDLAIFGGQVHLKRDSLVEGDVAIVGGDATLEGRIEGDVVVFGGQVELASTAIVDGDMVVLGQMRRAAGSQIRGSLIEGLRTDSLQYLPRVFNGRPGMGVPVQSPNAPNAPNLRWLGRLAGGLGTLVVLLLLAAFLTVTFSNNLAQITRVLVRSPLISLGVGLLTIVVAAVLVPILVVICIGAPVAVVLVVALLLAALIGWVAAGQVVGRYIFQALKLQGQPSPLLEAVAGVLLLAVVATIGAFGKLIALLVASWGVGAVLLTRLGRLPYPVIGSFAQPPAAFGAAPAAQDDDGPRSAPEADGGAADVWTSAGESAQPPQSAQPPTGETKLLDPADLPDDLERDDTL